MSSLTLCPDLRGARVPQPPDLNPHLVDGLGQDATVGLQAAMEVPALMDEAPQGGWLDVQIACGGLELDEEGMVLAHALEASVKPPTFQAQISHKPKCEASGYASGMDVNDIFRMRLKAEMQAQGYNPASLSLKAGLNRRAVTDILGARSRSPSLSTIHALATALGIGLDELTGLRPQVSIAPLLAELLGQYSEAEQEQLAKAIAALPRGPDSAR